MELGITALGDKPETEKQISRVFSQMRKATSKWKNP